MEETKVKGYIFEYYKYIRYTKDSLKELANNMGYKEAEKTILTFGDYDRLKVNQVTEFSRFRDLSDLAKMWIGNRQSVLLYELDEEPLFEYMEKGDEFGFWNKKEGKMDDHLFWALTEFSFVSAKRNDSDDYEKLLQETKQNLETTIEQCKQDDIEVMVLGTMGSFGITILWFGNQYTSILRLVDKIKEKNPETFLSAYTTISKNPQYNEYKSNEALIDNIEGKALLQITLKKHINMHEIELDKFEIRNISHTSGEYDLVVTADAKDIYKYFENENIFNHDTDDYQKVFLQTKITLLEKLEKLPTQGGDSSNTTTENTSAKSMMEEYEKVNKNYIDVRNEIRGSIDKTAGLIDTLDSLLCDYRCNVVSASNENWAKDFSYIFLKNLECMQELLAMKNTSGVELLKVLRMVMNRLKQQVFHIAEANPLNLEIPKCHLRYTGQEDSVLFCYMGIIKHILQTAYGLEGVNSQCEIVPIVTVDVVPIIESELYFDKITYIDENEEDQQYKILSLNLPHVAFYSIPVYMQYMYHEIYHYIVPRDREERDYYIGSFCTMSYIQKILLEHMKEVVGDNEKEADTIVKYIEPLIYQYVADEYYQQIHLNLVPIGKGEMTKSEIDKVYLIEKVYIKKLQKYLSASENISFWYNCYKYIYDNLTMAKVAGLSFEEMGEKCFGLDANNGEVEKIKKILWDEKLEEKLESVIYKYGKYGKILVDKIVKGVKEIYADIPMIEFSKMPLDEYLLFYSDCLKNMLVKPEKFDYDTELKEQLRVGIILEFYNNQKVSLESIKEIYIWKYIAKYFTFSSGEPEIVAVKIEKFKTEANEWLKFFERCQEYRKRFIDLGCNQLLEYINRTKISTRCSNYNVEEKSKEYFGAYRDAYTTYAKGLKELYEKYKHMPDSQSDYYRTIEKAFDEAVFKENIKLLHHFQKQLSLKELSEINQKCNREKRDRATKYEQPQRLIPISRDAQNSTLKQNYKLEVKVSTIESFMRELQRITHELQKNNDRVFGKKNLPVWYRGQENSKYGLLPSVMRPTRAKNRSDFHYLSQYQRYLYEEFKYRADGAPEIMDRSYYNISDYLALMQHYGVATNFMDWSEDAFAALYFAFEKLITNAISDANSDASVMVFSPHLYNEARKYMIQEEASKMACTEAAFRASIKTADRFDGWIPNIAAKHNESIYDVFLLGNISYETGNQYGNKQKVELKGEKEIAYLPIALYTSRLNPRLRSQSGIFLAYNLYAEPSIGNDFSYLEMENIQKYYLNVCKRDVKYPFLYKIIITKESAKDFSEFLKIIGMSKERIYPELSSIGERIK